MSRARQTTLAAAAIVVVAVFAAGLCKIADLDFWWHLKTGELIVQEGEIPRQDVYSYTAAGREYVDHEWLFQVSQYVVFDAFGPSGIAIFKSLIASLTAVIVLLFSLRRGVPPTMAVGMVFLAVAGGITRLIERPEVFTVLFAVSTYVLLRRGSQRQMEGRSDAPDGPAEAGPYVLIPLICALWANIHAAVIVGLVIQVLFIAGSVLERKRVARLLFTFVASVAASMLNPFGYRVLTVPFELTHIIESGVFNNAEWTRPTVVNSPVYYLLLVVTILLMIPALRARRFADVLIAGFLGYISLRYVRNIALFSMFAPMLVAPELVNLSARPVWRRGLPALGAAALLFVLTIYYPFERGFGVASYFPDRLTQFIEANGVRGHMLNSYSFGGYLIWSLYPEHRIFMDGRNEVFLPLMQKLVKARSDSRAWNALLGEYAIEFAVLEYVDDLDRVTTVRPDGSRVDSFAPITATRFPRSRWALIYWDDDGMLFVRRGGANEALIAREYKAVFPEGDGYQSELVRLGLVDRNAVILELQRKLAEDPASHRARVLLDSLRSGS